MPHDAAVPILSHTPPLWINDEGEDGIRIWLQYLRMLSSTPDSMGYVSQNRNRCIEGTPN